MKKTIENERKLRMDANELLIKFMLIVENHSIANIKFNFTASKRKIRERILCINKFGMKK